VHPLAGAYRRLHDQTNAAARVRSRLETFKPESVWSRPTPLAPDPGLGTVEGPGPVEDDAHPAAVRRERTTAHPDRFLRRPTGTEGPMTTTRQMP
jgi:hypothetical protein